MPDTLLSLPRELRDLIYSFVALDDLSAFADSFRRPLLLLHVSKQLGREYSEIFFALIHIQQYFAETASWCAVIGEAAKKNIFLYSAFADLSLNHYGRAGAQRHCQHRAHRWSDGCCGILTISINGSPRYWMWRVGPMKKAA